SELVALLAVPEGELTERVRSDLERRKELEKLVEELQGELLELRARELVSRSEGPFFLELPEASIPEAQRLARAVLNLTQALVVINLGERLVLAHNLPAGPNLGQLIKDQAQPLGGRGGGSPTAAQVYFPDPGRLQEFLGVLRQEIAGKS
ncbi:MAG TPA: hypothetical protein DCQ17_07350, partial [Firmicutes bacterium]|nr:hypothetical protein [Bacillota bacterium]